MRAFQVTRSSKLSDNMYPAMESALTVCLAAIWHDAVNDIPEDALQDVVAHLLNVLLCVTIATVVKSFLYQLPSTRTRNLVAATTQMIAGWMWKALIEELIVEAQYPTATQLDTNHTQPPDWNKRIMWTCQSVSVAFAWLATLSVVIILRVLPVAKPAPGSRCYAPSTVGLILCEVLAGSCPLPLAWAWHHWLFDVTRAIMQPMLLNPRSEIHSWSEYQRWYLHLGIMAGSFLVSLCLLGGLRSCLKPFLASRRATCAEGSAAANRISRYELITFKTFDFLVAWTVYGMLTSLRASESTTTCFPQSTPYLLHDLEEYVIVLMMAGVAIFFFVVAVGRAHLQNRVPEQVCGSAFVASCFAVLLGTVPIQLGWAVKAFYNEVFDWIVELENLTEEHETITDIAIAASIVFTIVTLFFYSYFFGEMRRVMAKGPSPSLESKGEGTAGVKRPKLAMLGNGGQANKARADSTASMTNLFGSRGGTPPA